MKIVKFYATWCEPCKQLDKVFEKYKPKLETNGIKYEAVDVDQNIQVAKELGIRGVPTVLLVDEETNKVIRSHVGMMTEQQLDTFIVRGNH